jgi:hypothetical protein
MEALLAIVKWPRTSPLAWPSWGTRRSTMLTTRLALGRPCQEAISVSCGTGQRGRPAAFDLRPSRLRSHARQRRVGGLGLAGVTGSGMAGMPGPAGRSGGLSPVLWAGRCGRG